MRKLLLRGEPYSRAWTASGAENIFPREGYPYHETLKKWFARISRFLPKRWKLEFSFEGSVFTAKTVTLEGRKGNMPLRKGTTMPEESLPKCIWVSLWSWLMAAAANAVGLTNRGLEWTLGQGKWQQWPNKFCISYSPTGDTRWDRALDAVRFMQMLKENLQHFKVRPALQINLSCPNTKEEFDVLKEGWKLLRIFRDLQIPLFIKVSVREPIDIVMALERHPALDGITFSNTILFSTLPWYLRLLYFGRLRSKLVKRGFTAGGVSGRPLYGGVLAYTKTLRAAGFKKVILAGGGILGPKHALELLKAGADGIVIGSMTFLRPWRVTKTIQAVLAYDN